MEATTILFPEQSFNVSSPEVCTRLDHTWLYVRIYCHPKMSDDIILHILRPVEKELRKRGLITQFFFIRYIEGGYHLRVRFYGTRQALLHSSRTYINTQISQFFAQCGNVIDEPYDQGPDGMDDAQWQPWQPHKVQRPMPSYEYDRYDPETDRYGGPDGLLISEQHFQQSSYTAFRILEHERMGLGPRQNAMLLLMEATAAAFGFSDRQKLDAFGRQFAYWEESDWLTADHVRRFTNEYERYRQPLLRLVPVAKLHAAEHRSRTTWKPIVQIWHDEMQETYDKLADLQSQTLLAASLPTLMVFYIHMLCNRLAIFPPEEACLAYLLYLSYAEQLEIPNALAHLEAIKDSM